MKIKKVMSLLLAIIIMSCMLPTPVMAVPNGQGTLGSSGAASRGWYLANECFWKVSLYVAKNDTVQRETLAGASISDWHRIGGGSLNSYLVPSNFSNDASIIYGNKNKVDYMNNSATADGNYNFTATKNTGAIFIADPSFYGVPIDSEDTGATIEGTKAYFGNSYTLWKIIDGYASALGVSRMGLVENLPFTIDGVTANGGTWVQKGVNILPEVSGGVITSGVRWMIVYEPVAIIHMYSGTSYGGPVDGSYTTNSTKVAFTPTELAIADSKGFIEMDSGVENGANRQNMQKFWRYTLASSVLLEFAWAGFGSVGKSDFSSATPTSTVYTHGGFGMEVSDPLYNPPAVNEFNTRVYGTNAARAGERCTYTTIFKNATTNSRDSIRCMIKIPSVIDRNSYETKSDSSWNQHLAYVNTQDGYHCYVADIAFEPNKSKFHSFSFIAPPNIGDFEIKSYINYENRWYELDATNNEFTAPLNIYDIPTAHPTIGVQVSLATSGIDSLSNKRFRVYGAVNLESTGANVNLIKNNGDNYIGEITTNENGYAVLDLSTSTKMAALAGCSVAELPAYFGTSHKNFLFVTVADTGDLATSCTYDTEQGVTVINDSNMNPVLPFVIDSTLRGTLTVYVTGGKYHSQASVPLGGRQFEAINDRRETYSGTTQATSDGYKITITNLPLSNYVVLPEKNDRENVVEANGCSYNRIENYAKITKNNLNPVVIFVIAGEPGNGTIRFTLNRESNVTENLDGYIFVATNEVTREHYTFSLSATASDNSSSYLLTNMPYGDYEIACSSPLPIYHSIRDDELYNALGMAFQYSYASIYEAEPNDSASMTMSRYSKIGTLNIDLTHISTCHYSTSLEGREFFVCSEGLKAYLDNGHAAIDLDIDGDGDITMEDASLVGKFAALLATPTPEQAFNSDTNGDGEITTNDWRLITRLIDGYEIYETFKTDADGKISLRVTDGKYYVTPQTNFSSIGHTITPNSAQVATITNDGDVVTLTHDITCYTGTINVSLSRGAGAYAKTTDRLFGLFTSPGSTDPIATAVTSESESSLSFTNVPLDAPETTTYYVKMLDTIPYHTVGAEDHVYSGDNTMAIITGNELNAAPGKAITTNFKIYSTHRGVIVVNVTRDTTTAWAGSAADLQFGLYTSATATTPIATAITSGTTKVARAVFANVEMATTATYYIKLMSSIPECHSYSWIAASTVTSTQLIGAENNTVSVSGLISSPCVGTVNVTVEKAAGCTADIANLEFRIIDSSTKETIATATTNASGMLTFNGLALGEDSAAFGYTVVAPLVSHYTLTPETTTITIGTIRTHSHSRNISFEISDGDRDATELTITKRIKVSEITWKHGNPTFLFSASSGTKTYNSIISFDKNYVDSHKTNDGYVEKSVSITVTAGTYTVREKKSIRYEFGGISNITNGTISGESAIMDLGTPKTSASVRFDNGKTNWKGQSGTDFLINSITTE